MFSSRSFLPLDNKTSSRTEGQNEIQSDGTILYDDQGGKKKNDSTFLKPIECYTSEREF